MLDTDVNSDLLSWTLGQTANSFCPIALHSKSSPGEEGTLPLMGSHLYEGKKQGKERVFFELTSLKGRTWCLDKHHEQSKSSNLCMLSLNGHWIILHKLLRFLVCLLLIQFDMFAVMSMIGKCCTASTLNGTIRE